MKILLADDDATIHAAYTRYLEKCGHTVFHAYDGEETVKVVIENSPDVIFLDLMMPKKDGRDICKMLKQQSDTKHIKIIMLSAKDQQWDRTLGFELGADDYITKPCSLDHIEHVLTKLLMDQKKRALIFQEKK